MDKQYQATPLDGLVDSIGEKCFGMTRTAAREGGVCISCHEKVFNEDGTINSSLIHSAAGLQEYRMSAMCEKCFDKMFEDEE